MIFDKTQYIPYIYPICFVLQDDRIYTYVYIYIHLFTCIDVQIDLVRWALSRPASLSAAWRLSGSSTAGTRVSGGTGRSRTVAVT